jgi:HAD superfamily hydrolase (TIGR01509 family)
MPEIKAVVFDLEGTVVNVESAHHNAHILAAKDVGVELDFKSCLKFLPHFIGGPDGLVAKEIAELAKQQGKIVDTIYIHERKKIHYNELLKTMEIKPRDGFVEFFNAVKTMGLKVTIGSVTSREQAMVLLDRSGVGKLVGYENIVLREDVTNPKPAPDIWLATAKKSGIEVKEQVVFEDSPGGTKGASAVGCYCVGMPVYHRPDIIKKLIESGSKRIFNCWTKINAEKLIRNIEKEHS